MRHLVSRWYRLRNVIDSYERVGRIGFELLLRRLNVLAILGDHRSLAEYSVQISGEQRLDCLISFIQSTKSRLFASHTFPFTCKDVIDSILFRHSPYRVII